MNMRDAKRLHPNWFSPSTMRFFDSIIESDMIGGRFFISSEQFRGMGMCADGPRLYTIRYACEDSIGTVGGQRNFQRYRTQGEALQVAHRLASLFPRAGE